VYVDSSIKTIGIEGFIYPSDDAEKDILEIKRIEKITNHDVKAVEYFIKKKFDKINPEKNIKPASSYAKRFAAKEAVSKALGTGIRKGINFKNIEILNDNFGKPFVQLKGSAAIFLKNKIKKKKYFIYLSLSDDVPWAQATVVISYN
jgi:holo-[acyl-carrier protein] synthase